MYLKYVQIVNFKNLKNVRFEFSKGANTIIGENDSGKSNALTAIRILLDDNYYYNTKRLKETDFSYALGDWKGHWIIISAFFDEISNEDKHNEFCAEITPEQENIDFLKSYIRCTDKDFGTVSLFIRPCRTKRIELAEAAQNGTFESVRSQIKLSDYEFYYTARSQADFTDENIYKSIVGDICAGQYVNPEDDDQSVLGCKIDIMNVWQHISTVFIDALRDVESELRKPKNPIRQIIDTIEGDIKENDIDDIKKKISELNAKIANIPQVSDIGKQVNRKLLEMIGAIYSPEIKLESRLKEDFATLARYLTISPSNQADIDLLGLGHLNILYIAMKLVEFEVNRNRELLNIMIIEEPEAHIHTHIQKTLFNNLQVAHTYTQVVMSTHSTHTLEVDFVSEESNKDFVCSVIRNTYKDAAVIERHVSTIKSGTEAERYDSVMTVANNIKKGWYATLLAETIDARAVIPMYILDAIVFAAKDILSEKLLWKMVQYSFEQYLPDSDFDDLKAEFKEAKSSKEIQTTIKKFCAEFPEDMVSLFIAKAGGLNV